MLKYGSVLHFLVWLNSIPLYGFVIFSLSTQQLIRIWLLSLFGYFEVVIIISELPLASFYVDISLGIYLRDIIRWVLWELCLTNFSKVVGLLHIASSSAGVLQFPISSASLVIVHLYHNPASEFEVTDHCGFSLYFPTFLCVQWSFVYLLWGSIC